MNISKFISREVDNYLLKEQSYFVISWYYITLLQNFCLYKLEKLVKLILHPYFVKYPL